MEHESLLKEITRLRSEPISADEREFVLALLRDARLNGVTELSYKALTLRISPAAASNAQRETYFAQQTGTAVGWNTTLPRVNLEVK